jgi:hypothetical protein
MHCTAHPLLMGVCHPGHPSLPTPVAPPRPSLPIRVAPLCPACPPGSCHLPPCSPWGGGGYAARLHFHALLGPKRDPCSCMNGGGVNRGAAVRRGSCTHSPVGLSRDKGQKGAGHTFCVLTTFPVCTGSGVVRTLCAKWGALPSTRGPQGQVCM